MRTNLAVKREPVFTHGGGRAAHITPVQQLRRSVLSCLLWEKEFYEDGQAIADRIRDEAQAVPVSVLSALAIEARSKFHLRHVPLYLTALLAKRGAGSSIVSETIRDVIQRADELTEFLSVYAVANGVKPDQIKPKLSNQVRKGLAMAFGKFNEYALEKYNRDNAIKLRDVLFLCHAKPKNPEQAALWNRLIDGELTTPDTWEVSLSAGANKRETFERLIREGHLGYLALLRNLRNMEQSGVDLGLVRDAILARKGAERVLPFRYVAAARAAPIFEPALDQALMASVTQLTRLLGKTILVVDVSGSMRNMLSAKSDLTRLDAACALAAIAREMCETPVVYATAGNDYTRIHQTALVPARHGIAMIDAISSQMMPLGGGGIFLTPALSYIKEKEKTADRIIVVTDEQDCAIDPAQSPLMATPFGVNNYLINVASAKNGVGYHRWTHLDGFSEHILRWIMEYELQ